MTIYKTLIILLVSFTFVNCEKASTCIPHFGCINFTNEWYHHSLRPVNLKPLQRHTVNTKFLLLRTEPDSKVIDYVPIIPNAADINIAPYEKHFALIVLIHDFTSNGYTGWIKYMTIYLAELECYNIIAVDWQEGAEPPFLQAISNARIVAMELVLLLKTLHEEFALCWNQMHLIGHGVGAHIAGYTGKALSVKVGRITGLDPTGPCFEGMPAVVHLDYDDAVYVEVLHTDGAGTHHQGTLQPLGNMDFYFNNGSAQPGCHNNVLSSMGLLEVTRNKLKEGAILPDCSHKRAFHYYIEAIRDKHCSFLAVPLGTPVSKPVMCSDPTADSVPCATIGLDIDMQAYSSQIYSKYEIDTPKCQPYCSNRYQMQVDLVECPEADKDVEGYFNVVLCDKDGLATNLTFNNNSKDRQVLWEGSRLTFTGWTHQRAVEVASSIQVTWHFTTPFCFFCRNATCVRSLAITHVRARIKDHRAPAANHFCSSDPTRPYAVLYDHTPNTQFRHCNFRHTGC